MRTILRISLFTGDSALIGASRAPNWSSGYPNKLSWLETKVSRKLRLKSMRIIQVLRFFFSFSVSFLSVSMTALGSQPAALKSLGLFDGTAPLQYGTVIGTKGASATFIENGHVNCSSPPVNTSTATKCGRSRAIPTNSVVAIANVVNGWAIVEWFDTDIVRTGLIRIEDLNLASERIGIGSRFSNRYRARLLKGRRLPVCESYLQQLNSTPFEVPPYCGRPNNPRIPGFEPIPHRFLTSAEAIPLLESIELFTTGRASANRPVVTNPSDEWPAAKLFPAVNIENDGVMRSVVVWSGTSGHFHAPCGSERYFGVNAGIRTRFVPYVLSQNLKSLDREATQRIFGHPAGAYGSPDSSLTMSYSESQWRTAWRPIGKSVELFSYRGTVYFSTFFDRWGDFKDQRRSLSKIGNYLGVFVRARAQTNQICELFVEQDYDRDFDPRMGP